MVDLRKDLDAYLLAALQSSIRELFEEKESKEKGALTLRECIRQEVKSILNTTVKGTLRSSLAHAVENEVKAVVSKAFQVDLSKVTGESASGAVQVESSKPAAPVVDPYRAMMTYALDDSKGASPATVPAASKTDFSATAPAKAADSKKPAPFKPKPIAVSKIKETEEMSSLRLRSPIKPTINADWTHSHHKDNGPIVTTPVSFDASKGMWKEDNELDDDEEGGKAVGTIVIDGEIIETEIVTTPLAYERNNSNIPNKGDEEDVVEGLDSDEEDSDDEEETKSEKKDEGKPSDKRVEVNPAISAVAAGSAVMAAPSPRMLFQRQRGISLDTKAHSEPTQEIVTTPLNAKGEPIEVSATEDDNQGAGSDKSGKPIYSATVPVEKVKRKSSLRTKLMKTVVGKIPGDSAPSKEGPSVPEECPTPTSTRSRDKAKESFAFGKVAQDSGSKSSSGTSSFESTSSSVSSTSSAPSAPASSAATALAGALALASKPKEKSGVHDKEELKKRLLASGGASGPSQPLKIDSPVTSLAGDLSGDPCPSPTSSRARAMTARSLTRAQSVLVTDKKPLSKPAASAEKADSVLTKRPKLESLPSLPSIAAPAPGIAEGSAPASGTTATAATSSTAAAAPLAAIASTATPSTTAAGPGESKSSFQECSTPSSKKLATARFFDLTAAKDKRMSIAATSSIQKISEDEEHNHDSGIPPSGKSAVSAGSSSSGSVAVETTVKAS